MSRLQTYLTESNKEVWIKDPIEKAKLLKDECGQFIKMLKKVNKPMPNKMVYRSIEGYNTQFAKSKPKMNRKPLDTPEIVHNMLDDAFMKHFGWRARSQSAMTSIRPRRGYGIMYYFFPTDGYTYLYNENVRDLYLSLEGLIKKNGILSKYISLQSIVIYIRDNGEEKVRELIDNFIKNGYNQNKGWSTIYSNDPEIMWKCKSYYILNTDMLSVQDGIKFFEELDK